MVVIVSYCWWSSLGWRRILAHAKCEWIANCHSVETLIMLVFISCDIGNQTVGSSSGCLLGFLSFLEHSVALLANATYWLIWVLLSQVSSVFRSCISRSIVLLICGRLFLNGMYVSFFFFALRLVVATGNQWIKEYQEIKNISGGYHYEGGWGGGGLMY